ncbi:hypothetical protein COT60_03690 [Candidatus Pacearchaeota archaeon CG09_land_8_20_14_0_10_30_9]|nr:hypothetical protein [Candidatus Pacearchaeota archaeon]OIO39773.1 MAG: hypothetical protein AUJ61_03525 [Candidatus Pacearchaeota archaeon CG1_02_30_18]PIN71727.1 MAG: hypothetical protein COV77_00480 [Candidatus Pacearchaeota archaeon CG11_big_fil_rev_8_21_14_0_20_30_13]PIO00810.1 MAG: hypothetical protein COT60_03690 [Candidatus Pacearchaeota archaeon CG09_land_8_20_14_0_10_30_9]PJA71029.1 MAG: hypothetical protein CO153_03650 [Candidatus Pacearchaeota archaeon CG_4_9_14_3_um_filter_30_11
MKESENLLRILEQSFNAFKSKDSLKLKKLSNETVHTSSLTQDSSNILIAVVIYSLGKLLERENYFNLPGWKNFESLTTSALKISIEDLKQNKEEKFTQDFIQIRKAIGKISGKLKKYIEEVFEKSEITKASRIYEHGISLGQTSKLLGITIYDLANYTGQTGISEVSLNQTINEKERVKMLEDMFI